ncbi:MAG: hypothetical protein M1823_003081 [Watsoniomyces obsoletus]|nr:MAG: hypothetical protein M1823_003081 [Watsoniomyces obsoletus]
MSITRRWPPIPGLEMGHRPALRFPFHSRAWLSQSRMANFESRIGNIGRPIEDEYAVIRAKYQTPKHPIILAHGLLGFDELHLVPGHLLPGVRYWRGIREALAANGIEVFTASVPPSASVEERAAKLSNDIAQKAGGRDVNIIAHSMSEQRLPKIYKALESLGMESGAFSQLTRRYMQDEFNPRTPDVPGVRYFSYGASVEPSLFSVFRHSHRIIEREEGPNDGLVSVASSQWGGEEGYKGTLMGVSHLDLINWTNRLQWLIWELTGKKRK